METNRILIETTIIIEYLRTRHRATITNFEKAIATFDECCLYTKPILHCNPKFSMMLIVACNIIFIPHQRISATCVKLPA